MVGETTVSDLRSLSLPACMLLPMSVSCVRRQTSPLLFLFLSLRKHDLKGCQLERDPLPIVLRRTTPRRRSVATTASKANTRNGRIGVSSPCDAYRTAQIVSVLCLEVFSGKDSFIFSRTCPAPRPSKTGQGLRKKGPSVLSAPNIRRALNAAPSASL